jgi:CBS domain-containing protein
MAFSWFTVEARPPEPYLGPSVRPPPSAGATPPVEPIDPDGQRRHPYGTPVEPPAPRRIVVSIDRIMTAKVTTVSPETTILDAWRIMVARRFRHLPIVQGGRPVGIVSDRDLLRETSPFGGGQVEDTAAALTAVSRIMKRRVLTATPDTSVREAARVMFENRIGSMLVVDGERLAGIVTRSDVLRTLMHEMPLDLWS